MGAGAIDFEGVGDVGEAGGRGDAVGPRLDLGSFDLDGPSAVPADQVMVMVVGRAATVDGLTVVAAQYVDLAPVGEDLQVPVDSGETDSLAHVAQVGVQVLGAGERVDLGQCGADGVPLAGGPYGGSASERSPAAAARPTRGRIRRGCGS